MEENTRIRRKALPSFAEESKRGDVMREEKDDDQESHMNLSTDSSKSLELSSGGDGMSAEFPSLPHIRRAGVHVSRRQSIQQGLAIYKQVNSLLLPPSGVDATQKEGEETADDIHLSPPSSSSSSSSSASLVLSDEDGNNLWTTNHERRHHLDLASIPITQAIPIHMWSSDEEEDYSSSESSSFSSESDQESLQDPSSLKDTLSSEDL